MNAKDLLSALNAFEKEKGISKEIVVEALKEAIEKAYIRNTDMDALCRVEIDPKKGTLELYAVKNVVEVVEDDVYEIELEDAQKIDPKLKVGDNLETPVDTDTLSRLAAMQARQVLTQKIREFEKQNVYDAYIDKKDDIIIGIVERVEHEFILVNIGKTSAVMSKRHILPGETFKLKQAIRVYVVDVDKSSSGAAVTVSRTEPGFLKRLFENEIHEVYDGTVEIKDIARQAGDRAKVSVFSRNKDVDATGACIGRRGSRIQKISNQIQGEKIDVIQYYENKVLYIAEALRPAVVVGIQYDDETKSALAIVKDEDLSLAIGKKGVNARLAVKLTGIRIDIKTETVAMEEQLEYVSVEEAREEFETSKYIAKIKPQPVVTPLVDSLKPEVTKTIKEEVVKPVEVKRVEPIKVTPIPTYQPRKPVSKPAYVGRKQKELVIPKAPKQEDFGARKPFVKKEEERQEIKRNVITSKELEEIKKKHEEARTYMPVYTKDELKELEEEKVETVEKDDFYDDIDYDDYDEYYDEE